MFNKRNTATTVHVLSTTLVIVLFLVLYQINKSTSISLKMLQAESYYIQEVEMKRKLVPEAGTVNNLQETCAIQEM